MSTKLASQLLVVLVLPLLAAAPFAVLAQTPPAANSGRKMILNQLEHIRLGSVRYDDLPLAEVVRNLRDQTRKSDPDKKGVNFAIHSTSPSGGKTAVEPVDAGSVRIRINPALSDVRLVDALDAIVMVADRPIQYRVEDDGVVFFLKGSDPAVVKESGFAFPGGTPIQFIDAVQKYYQVDWVSVADIPKDMEDVRIPRLRINRDSLQPILARTEGEVTPLAALVSLYNQLGEQKQELGRLVVKGNLANPSVVSFVPGKTAEARPKIKVEAFSIYGMSDAEEGKLRDDIERASVEATGYAYNVHGFSDPRNLQGTVAIHQDTSLLVAIGPEPFVEMVESIVNAFQAKAAEMGHRSTAARSAGPGK